MVKLKKIKELDFGYADAENYKKRENKVKFQDIFIKNEYLDKVCKSSTSFLVGEKGTGKTAYAVYLSNNDYKNTISDIKYIRETEYSKFITLKKNKELDFSDYSTVWKVILMLLFSNKIKSTENDFIGKLRNVGKFNAIDNAINEFYYNAFIPEIKQSLSFAEDSKIAAEFILKNLKLGGESSEEIIFNENRYQMNLMYIQRKFEESLSQIKLSKNHLLFIDGIDIRPHNIDFDDYLDCIKGLANAVWELNNDFFANIKDSVGRCRVVLLVRPDIFDSLGLQNQNTKIRDNSVLLDWHTDYLSHRSSKIFEVIDKLISSQQDESLELGEAWDSYFPWNASNVFDSYDVPTSFIAFMRWSYYRPRDFIKMLGVLQDSISDQGTRIVKFKDFEESRFQREYSDYLLGEVKDQLSFYYKSQDFEYFLKFFEFLKGKHKFNYKEYVEAFNELDIHLKSIKADIPIFMSSANEFLQFLFDLNVVCYFVTTHDGKSHIHWCFKERSYSNLSPKVKTNQTYEVFYGLAKALDLGKEYN